MLAPRHDFRMLARLPKPPGLEDREPKRLEPDREVLYQGVRSMGPEIASGDDIMRKADSRADERALKPESQTISGMLALAIIWFWIGFTLAAAAAPRRLVARAT